jgi:tRNA nucleotidyltransferase/poly(A) polymerase/murein DD-endopeptidase MepM/ murein hydrolase activator NlpD
MFKWAQEESDIDALISKLLGGESVGSEGTDTPEPAEEPEPSQFEQQQYYQLPVKHTRGGALIDEENKPWIIGHFAPGEYLNVTHPGGHHGVDLKAPKGSPVYPIGPGKVTKVISDWKTRYGVHNCRDYQKKRKAGVKMTTAGNQVTVAHEDGKVVSTYLHLDEAAVTVGQKVGLSTVIGAVGETGNAMCRGGGHLHYEVRVDGTLVDPQRIVGKPIGSLSKKAQFIKRLVAELGQKPNREERFRALRKIAIEINEEITLTETEEKIFDLLRQVVAEKAPGTTLRVADAPEGPTLRVAGGWVRDKLMGKESHDIDISVDNMSGLAFARLVRDWMQEHGMPVPKDVAVVEANPEAKKSLETAILKIYGISIDFVQMREDVYTSDTRRPTIVLDVTPEQDARRRDLTINSIFYNINEGKIEDYVGGVEDLKKGVARTPLDPYKTFMEDPLRILRTIRFAAKYNLEVDPDLIEAAKHPDVQDAFKQKISKERIWSELVGQPEGEGWKRGLMVGPNFHRAAELMGEMGLRDLLLVPTEEQMQRATEQSTGVKEKPKWEQGFGHWDMEQNNPYHTLTVWRHTLEALNYLNQVQEASVSEQTERAVEDQVVRNIAMLLHDVGKCDACSQQTHPEKGHSTYHEHDISSAVVADEILRDLKAPKNIRERVVTLIKHHMRLHNLPAGSTGSGLRRVVRDVGAENWPLLIEMTKSDSMGKEKAELDPKYDAFAKAINDFLEKTKGQSEAKVPLNGREIMNILGLERGGPAVGAAVKALKEKMMENPEMTKEEAEAFLRSRG